MYNMKMVEINEKTNQRVMSEYCSEEEVFNGRKRGQKGVFNRYNDNCILGIRNSKETQNNQAKLDYWKAHLDEWNEYHRADIEAGDMKPNEIREELTYYVMHVQLLDDDRVILERTFRYGK